MPIRLRQAVCDGRATVVLWPGQSLAIQPTTDGSTARLQSATTEVHPLRGCVHVGSQPEAFVSTLQPGRFGRLGGADCAAGLGAGAAGGAWGGGGAVVRVVWRQPVSGHDQPGRPEYG